MCFLLHYTGPIFKLILLDIFHLISFFPPHQNRKKVIRHIPPRNIFPVWRICIRDPGQGTSTVKKKKITYSFTCRPVAFFPPHPQSTEHSPDSPSSLPLDCCGYSHMKYCMMGTNKFLGWSVCFICPSNLVQLQVQFPENINLYHYPIPALQFK